MSLSCCPSPSQVSPYPVILSLENHCGLEQQAAMARHLHTILGDMLVTQTLDSQNPEELPSPEVRLSDPQPGWGEGLAPRLTIQLCSGPFSSVLNFWGFFFWPPFVAYGFLVPRPGIKPTPPVVELRSLNRWTDRKVLSALTFSCVTVHLTSATLWSCHLSPFHFD